MHECDGAKVRKCKVQRGAKMGKAEDDWQALYWPDYVVLTDADYVTLCLATAFAGLSSQSLAAGPRSLCLGRRECRRPTPP